MLYLIVYTIILITILFKSIYDSKFLIYLFKNKIKFKQNFAYLSFNIQILSLSFYQQKNKVNLFICFVYFIYLILFYSIFYEQIFNNISFCQDRNVDEIPLDLEFTTTLYDNLARTNDIGLEHYPNNIRNINNNDVMMNNVNTLLNGYEEIIEENLNIMNNYKWNLHNSSPFFIINPQHIGIISQNLINEFKEMQKSLDLVLNNISIPTIYEFDNVNLLKNEYVEMMEML
jgi:hypothetical protein